MAFPSASSGSLAIDLTRLFDSRDPYTIFGIEYTATEAVIKRAFYRLAKIHHPDKSYDQHSTEKFQAIGKLYAILSDPEKRKIYDTSHCFDDEIESINFAEFETRLKPEDILSFKKSYQGSPTEAADLQVIVAFLL